MFDKFFHDIFDESFGGIFIISKNLRIKHLNKAAEKITGFTEKEAIGKYCYEILRAKCCKNACPIRLLKGSNKPEEFVVDILTSENKRKYIKMKVIQTQGFWVEIFKDITREVEQEKKLTQKYAFDDIITQSKNLLGILKEFPKIALSNVPVLFEGESGVGKEVFANVLQGFSLRKNEEYVKINCAALPDSLLESELFGYKKGAFTDARGDKPGLFFMADKGTLFLDEIAEISLPLQAKLLRAVETGEIIPLGSTRPEKTDVRIFSASNKNLSDEVTKGNFRQDLYYRLNVVTIYIPPLRERPSDIPLFVDFFIDHLNILQEKNISGISDEALEILMNHPFTGNVRELRNIMEHAFIFCKSGLIRVPHLPAYLRAPETKDKRHQHVSSDEAKMILRALDKAGWNRQLAAKILKMDRTTLWRKMKKFNIR